MSSGEPIYRVALVGCGTLGRQVAQGISTGSAGAYQLTAVFDSVACHRAKHIAGETGAVWCATLYELLATTPDYVVEAASGAALKEIAIPCLRSGAYLVALSTGAFADEGFLNEVLKAARKHQKRFI